MVKPLTGPAFAARLGGIARAKLMTTEERSESARQAAKARWANRSQQQRRDDLTIVRAARLAKKAKSLKSKGVQA